MLTESYIINHQMPHNPQKALELLLQAAAQGHTKALQLYHNTLNTSDDETLFNLAIYYYQSSHINQNKVHAFEIFKLAAERGNLKSAAMMGSYYYDGSVVEKNAELAIFWTRQAFCQETNNFTKEALHNLGVFHFEGFGVPQNTALAMQFFQQAAMLGSMPAVMQLSHYYAQFNSLEHQTLAHAYEKLAHYLAANVVSQKSLQSIFNPALSFENQCFNACYQVAVIEGDDAMLDTLFALDSDKVCHLFLRNESHALNLHSKHLGWLLKTDSQPHLQACKEVLINDIIKILPPQDHHLLISLLNKVNEPYVSLPPLTPMRHGQSTQSILPFSGLAADPAKETRRMTP